jgi:sterol desaturase/sphingolipid hydroxylase (fatty acid hydroxylase superfamily)
MVTKISALLSWVLNYIWDSTGTFVFCLGGFVLIRLGMYFHSHPKGQAHSLKQLCHFVFPPEDYRHRSSQIDFVVFAMTYLLLYGWMFALFALSEQTFHWLMLRVFGQPEHNLNIDGGIATLQFVLILLATDLGGFLQHYILHKVPFLWRLHRVHHSAEVLTPFTVSRAHPLEIVEQAITLPLLPAIVSGVMAYFTGGRLSAAALSLIGGIILYRSFMETFRHSSIWVSFGWHLNHVLYCPAMHQIHHSSLPHHHDKNMGDIFSVWDWIFGTLYVPRHREHIPYGISKEELGVNNPHLSLKGLLVEPVVTAIRCLFGQKAARQDEPSSSSHLKQVART